MIFIGDYRNPGKYAGKYTDRVSGELNLSALMGQTVSVGTAAGVFRGVVISEDAATLTLAYTVYRHGKKTARKLIISKNQIAAIETRL